MSNGPRPDGIILDLDDTLYAERSYFESGVVALAGWLTGTGGAGSDEWLDRLRADIARSGRAGMIDRIAVPNIAVHNGDGNGDDLATWRLSLLHVYRTHRPQLAPFDDVRPFLGRARAAGCRVALLTDGKSCVQRRKIRGLGLEAAFDAIVCTDDIDAPKPSPHGFRVAARLLGLAPKQCVYIADDARKDFIGPRGINMATIQIRRPLPWPLAGEAPGLEAEAERQVVSLDEAARILFGERA
jgi:putative hydrolase of the HAD superfamily